MPTTDISECFFTTAQNPNLQLGHDFTNTRKFSLNRPTQRNLAKNISRVYHTISNPTDLREPLVELHKYPNLPDVLSLVPPWLMYLSKTLNALLEVLKIKKGQKINLIQVTGKVKGDDAALAYVLCPL